MFQLSGLTSPEASPTVVAGAETFTPDGILLLLIEGVI
jgi:hypothetical protein